MNKSPDAKAAAIVFGVELETFIPSDCRVSVGPYHSGTQVLSGHCKRQPDGSREVVFAPEFGGNRWRADNDGSIRPAEGYISAEFVSPKLKGEAGLIALDAFVEFAKKIGAKVNGSCGCHVTVSIPSVIGSKEPAAIAAYVRKLVRVTNHHSWALFAQTGTGRHENTFCLPPSETLGEMTNLLTVCEKSGDKKLRSAVQQSAGRGMINLNKAFPSDTKDSAVEFRLFAGTVNRWKVMHHVATCLGLMRKAFVTKHTPHFSLTTKGQPEDAQGAMYRLWRSLGWIESEAGYDIPLGLFGIHHEHFNRHSAVALKMAAKFQSKYPREKVLVARKAESAF